MKEKIWGFSYGSLCCMDIRCLELHELTDTWASPRTYESKREALEALAKRLNELLKE